MDNNKLARIAKRAFEKLGKLTTLDLSKNNVIHLIYPFHIYINKSHPLAVHGHPGNVILLFRTITGPRVILAEK